MTVVMERAATVLARCDDLARFSDEPGRLTRAYGTDAMRHAQDRVALWMREAGMTVRGDAVGNLIGRYEGGDAGAKTLLLGSHLDTVRDAGRYDGALGVVAAVAAVSGLREAGVRLPFAVEVVAFADEEGLRFQTTYLGSRALAGGLDTVTLAVVDADGITVADAIRGRAGHAGTVPMDLRQDALRAAAEFALTVEATAREWPGLVATVGQFAVEPGACNVVPGQVALSVDVRHAADVERDAACIDLQEQAIAIAEAVAIEDVAVALGVLDRFLLNAIQVPSPF